jgi:NAD(P)H-hydrate epimerase
VQTLCSQPPEAYTGAAAQQLAAYQAFGGPLAWAEEGWELPPCDLLLDAVSGCEPGLRRRGRLRELIQLANSSQAPILSLGAPSGVESEQSEQARCSSTHVNATATLLLGVPRSGLIHPPALQACGELWLADIGIPAELYTVLGMDRAQLFGRDPLVRFHVIEGKAVVYI